MLKGRVLRGKLLEMRILRVREACLKSLGGCSHPHPVLGRSGTTRHLHSSQGPSPQPPAGGHPQLRLLRASRGNKDPVSSCSAPPAFPWHRWAMALRKPKRKSSYSLPLPNSCENPHLPPCSQSCWLGHSQVEIVWEVYMAQWGSGRCDSRSTNFPRSLPSSVVTRHLQGPLLAPCSPMGPSQNPWK